MPAAAHDKTSGRGAGRSIADVEPPRPLTSRAAVRVALGLVLVALLARLAYLAWWCPYTLIEDEAHYWEWSRRLGLSYYSKGPGIAWLIRAFTEVFGETEFAVRAQAAAASAVSAAAVGVLAARFARTRQGPASPGRSMLFGVIGFMVVPGYQVLGVFGTIDGPYVACWSLAALFLFLGVIEHRRWAWPLAGVAIGAGFLFKYTMLLILPGLAVYALMRWVGGRRSPRTQAAAGDTPAPPEGMAGGMVAAVVGIAVPLALAVLPVALWNDAHGWPTVRHLAGHIGMSWGDMPPGTGSAAGGGGWSYNPAWTLEFIGSQLGVGGAMLGAMWIGWTDARRSAGAEARRGAALLIALGTPVLLFYLLLTLGTRVEANWPIAGYVTLIALAAPVLAERVAESRRVVSAWRRKPRERRIADGQSAWKSPEYFTHGLWKVAVVGGVLVGVVMLRLDLLARVPVVGDAVPIGRLTGGREMAGHTLELMGELRDETLLEPFVVTQHYGRASILAFYLPRDAVVLCASAKLGGRLTQYDFWHDTALDSGRLYRHPAVAIGATETQWLEAFEAVEPVAGDGGAAGGALRGDSKRDKNNAPTRPAWKCRGYVGFPGARPRPTRIMTPERVQ